MAIMVGVVGALSAFYHTNFDINSAEDRRYAAILLISKNAGNCSDVLQVFER